ncbi:MAG: hypothetical protein ABIO96_14035 [Nitrospiraceae bacterium]
MMRTDRMRGLLLLILALSSNACIVTYQVEHPATMETSGLPRKDLTLFYSPPLGPYTPGVSHKVFVSLVPGSYPLVSTGQGSDELDRVLANNDVFVQTTRTLLPNPPDQGLYCSILIWAHHSTLGNWLYSTPVESGGLPSEALLLPIYLVLLLQGSTALFPWWSSEAGYSVEYILYVDGKRERSYSYEITKKGVGWIGLLPVAWINFFTQDAKDAFRATAYQFFRDADRDGYLGGK